ncbi:M61 family metallopeptidase [Comamonas composti]|uniref:M61 family metallopeptidase n=1 Tax=Comamonas composti TaxID=408558 RepID=UPI0003F986F1|nr:M61 family metallopeptidase [Comamonas composti]
MPATAQRPGSSAAAGLHYRVQAHDLHAHLFSVQLRIARPAARQRLSLPVWIPGSYLVREFSKNLQALSAEQDGRSTALRQLAKNLWEIDCSADLPVVVSYQFCAYDNSVRTAWLDSRRGFFNGTSLCLRVHGQEQAAHTLELAPSPATSTWQVATGLEAVTADAQGWGIYRAADYDELVDCPVELGRFWRGEFTAAGIPHSFVVAGATPGFDGARLLADTQKICETLIAFWHGEGEAATHPPMQRYVFMLNAVDDGYGGLEHRNSTALICGRRDLPRQGLAKAADGYTTLLGLISHEYFHTWNVKRLRPREFSRYDYESENYTELLWFFEGFTSYYDDLLLRRAGLLDSAQYLKLITRTINQVLQTPGRHEQSVAQASFDAWVKYYRQDENTPNQTVSYYTKGALVALCLDLTLRREGRTTLDEVMRALWLRCEAGPMGEDDVLTVLQELGGRSFEAEIAQWVHGKSELPLAELLAAHGIKARAEPAQLAQRLGLRVQESHSIHIKTVLRGSLAEQAGFMAGDEWLALEVAAGSQEAEPRRWRLNRLDDLSLYAGPAPQVQAWVARDRELLALQLDWALVQAAASGEKSDSDDAKTASSPASAAQAPSNLGLEITDAEAAQRWLGGQAQPA